jgi:hypothetical protein
MRQTVNLFILTVVLSVQVYAQKRKLPPEGTMYLISNVTSEFPRQAGLLEVIKDDSARRTIYKTDSSEMMVDQENIVAILTKSDKKNKSATIHYRLDTLVTLLFKNGLLTPDLLIKSFNTKTKYINHKGDTIDGTHHTETKSLIIRYVKQKEYDNLDKPEERELQFEVAVTFNEKLEGYTLPAIHNFIVYLRGDFNPSDSNLTNYLKTAKIKHLTYIGTQI